MNHHNVTMSLWAKPRQTFSKGFPLTVHGIKTSLRYHFRFSCVGKSGSKVQAQGPAIPKCCNNAFSISLSGHTLLVQSHLIFRFFICRLVFEEAAWRCTAPEAIQTTVQSKSMTTMRGQGQKGQSGLRSERSNIMDTGVS